MQTGEVGCSPASVVRLTSAVETMMRFEASGDWVALDADRAALLY